LSEVSSIKDFKYEKNFRSASKKNISKVPERVIKTPQSKRNQNINLMFKPNTSLRKKKPSKMIGRNMIFLDDISLNDTQQLSEMPAFRSKIQFTNNINKDSRINVRPSYADRFEEDGLDDQLDM
jgi:hypothetical protein